jgi:hypothetical protein
MRLFDRLDDERRGRWQDQNRCLPINDRQLHRNPEPFRRLGRLRNLLTNLTRVHPKRTQTRPQLRSHARLATSDADPDHNFGGHRTK